MKKIKPAVFVDFDGTITMKDIGDTLFQEFGEFEPWHNMLLSGEISITEYWKTVVSSLKKDLTAEEIAKFSVSHEIDPYFIKFADFCWEQNINISVISDGFDAYIYPFLKFHGLDRLNVECNILKPFDSGFIPIFPNASESCCGSSASCKRNAILKNVSDDEIIVFIGDGQSDFCSATHADIIFAKRKLAAYCNENRIPHYPYSNFFDVQRIFKDVIQNKKLKVRHQAYLLRKKAFEIE